MQGSSDDENNYGDGPDEAIRTRTSYIDPQMPKKYSFVDEMMPDENSKTSPSAQNVTLPDEIIGSQTSIALLIIP